MPIPPPRHGRCDDASCEPQPWNRTPVVPSQHAAERRDRRPGPDVSVADRSCSARRRPDADHRGIGCGRHRGDPRAAYARGR